MLYKWNGFFQMIGAIVSIDKHCKHNLFRDYKGLNIIYLKFLNYKLFCLLNILKVISTNILYFE